MDRDDYLREAQQRIATARERLDKVKQQVEEAVAARHAATSDRLRKSEQQADAYLAALILQLDALRAGGDEAWDETRRQFERNLDGLCDSIHKIVARFSR